MSTFLANKYIYVSSSYSLKPRDKSKQCQIERRKMFILTLMTFVALIKLTAYKLCSSIPVPMVRILGSKMMSFGLKPSFFTRRW